MSDHPSPQYRRGACAGRPRPRRSRSKEPAPRADAADPSGTTSSRRPGAVRDGSIAEPGPDSYHRYPEDVELLAAARRRPVPLLDLVGARAADGHGRREPRRASPTTTASSTPSSPPVSRRSRRCTTGTCRRRSRRRADGSIARPRCRFADYTALVADALGDRVKDWYTINEPVSTSLQGYAIGELAPGRQLLFDSLPTVHHQLLAHGLATARAARSAAPTTIGIVNNHTDVRPASESAEDRTRRICLRHPAQPDLRRAGAAGALSRARGGRHPADAGRTRRPRADLARRPMSTGSTSTTRRPSPPPPKAARPVRDRADPGRRAHRLRHRVADRARGADRRSGRLRRLVTATAFRRS